MTTLKIAHILGSSDKQSSYYKSVKPVGDALSAMGHRVDYIWWEDIERSGPNEHYVRLTGLTTDGSGSDKLNRLGRKVFGRHLFYLLFSGVFCRQLAQKLDLAGYDVVFVHGINIIPMWRLHCPHVFFARTLKSWSFIEKRRYGPLARPIFKKIYHFVLRDKTIAAISSGVRDDLIAAFKLSGEHIRTAYSPVDRALLHALSDQAPDLELPDKYLMAAGRPDRSKRFDRLLRAYAMSGTRVPLLLFGQGKLFAELKRQAEVLGIADRVYFPGRHNNLMPYYRRAQATIVPSDIEGLPRVALESLSLGTPVIATDFPGAEDIFTGPLADWMVPKDDEAALAAKIAAFAADPPTVPESSLERFKPEHIANNYLALTTLCLQQRLTPV